MKIYFLLKVATLVLFILWINHSTPGFSVIQIAILQIILGVAGFIMFWLWGSIFQNQTHVVAKMTLWWGIFDLGYILFSFLIQLLEQGIYLQAYGGSVTYAVGIVFVICYYSYLWQKDWD